MPSGELALYDPRIDSALAFKLAANSSACWGVIPSYELACQNQPVLSGFAYQQVTPKANLAFVVWAVDPLWESSVEPKGLAVRLPKHSFKVLPGISKL